MPNPRRPRSSRRAVRVTAPPGQSSERELIVIARSEAGLRATATGIAAADEAGARPLARVLSKRGAVARSLFGVNEERLRHETASLGAIAGLDLPDLSVYYKVEAPDAQMDELAKELRALGAVQAAYVKPPAEPPAILNDMAPAAEDAPPVSPDFTPRQIYLDPAPAGIDARFAWTLGGGRGAGIRIVDIEGAWRFTHEDLTQNQGGVVGGTESPDLAWRNHGTAVVGEFGGDVNGFGVTGICADANVSAVSIFGGIGSAGALRHAANRLRAGDIILIELHRAGPRFNFQPRADQRGYIAIEWWPDDFDAIRFAIGRGIIVVEAGGNGAENLDAALYNTPGAGFPAGWTNPFNRANRDSGAIVVGAGAPPPGTHGRDHGPDRSRLDFSNYGALVDTQGWGREVTTCGYGDLQGGMNEDVWYTDRFSGTSSASPIVVGALGCVQGHLRGRGMALLTPARARQCLRNTGSPQQDGPGRPRTQRIGNRPNLRDLIACAVGKLPKELKEVPKELTKELKERPKELKDLKDRPKETKDLKERPKDLKDTKETKEKDLKEKDLKETKEKDLKDTKEKDVKEFKEKDKDIIETGSVGPGSDLAARVAQLEAVVGQLAHFIAPELRPDLSTGALGNEADLQALNQDLGQQGDSAKSVKDAKDVEKLREG